MQAGRRAEGKKAFQSHSQSKAFIVTPALTPVLTSPYTARTAAGQMHSRAIPALQFSSSHRALHRGPLPRSRSQICSLTSQLVRPTSALPPASPPDRGL